MPNPLLIKLGIQAIKDPKKTGKAILYLVIGIVAFFTIIGAVATSFISALVGNNVDENFKIENTEIYQNVNQTYEDYTVYLQDQLDIKEQEVIAEYAAKGIPVKVSKQINSINYSYLLAYLTQVDDSYKRGESVTFQEAPLTAYIKQISKIKQKVIKPEDQIDPSGETVPGEEPITQVILYNAVVSPVQAAAMMTTDEKIQDNYLISFNLYTDYLGQAGINTDGVSLYDTLDYIGDMAIAASYSEIPTYYQNDYKNVKYGTGTISSSGCAPTSLAMVLSYLTQSTIDPPAIVAWTGSKYYTTGQGSSWSIFSACASHWKISCTDLGSDVKSVVEAVSAGYPVIASVGPGTFTKGGHIIVISGITEDGYFIINDPNKSNVSKYGTTRFSCDLVFTEAKNFWKFN